MLLPLVEDEYLQTILYLEYFLAHNYKFFGQLFDRESSKRSYKLLSWNLTLTWGTKTFFMLYALFGIVFIKIRLTLQFKHTFSLIQLLT